MATLTFSFLDTFTASVRKNDLTIETAKLVGNEAAIIRIFEYGLQRILNDSVGAIKLDDHEGDADAYNAAVLAAAQDKWEGILEGRERTRKAPEDTREGMIAKVTHEWTVKAVKAAGRKWKSLTEAQQKVAQSRMGELKVKEIEKEADRRLKEAQTIAGLDLGLED